MHVRVRWCACARLAHYCRPNVRIQHGATKRHNQGESHEQIKDTAGVVVVGVMVVMMVMAVVLVVVAVVICCSWCSGYC